QPAIAGNDAPPSLTPQERADLIRQWQGRTGRMTARSGWAQRTGTSVPIRLPDLLAKLQLTNEEVLQAVRRVLQWEDWLNAGHQSEVEALIGTAHQHLPGVAKHIRQAMNKLDALKGEM